MGDTLKTVVAAIIIKDGQVLIARRGPHDKLANKWEFPGGKIEEGESQEECLVREIKEELDIDIKVNGYFGDTAHSYEHGAIHLIAYLASWVSGEPKLTVHDEYRLVPIEKLHDYDFAPADIPLVEKLVNK